MCWNIYLEVLKKIVFSNYANTECCVPNNRPLSFRLVTRMKIKLRYSLKALENRSQINTAIAQAGKDQEVFFLKINIPLFLEQNLFFKLKKKFLSRFVASLPSSSPSPSLSPSSSSSSKKQLLVINFLYTFRFFLTLIFAHIFTIFFLCIL